jgi:hypothetical protein
MGKVAASTGDQGGLVSESDTGNDVMVTAITVSLVTEPHVYSALRPTDVQVLHVVSTEDHLGAVIAYPSVL